MMFLPVSPSYLDIDFLRDCAAKYDSKPYWFGLGFIQLKLSDEERMHFWLPELPAEERDEVHNHRYTFHSRILDGTLVQQTYAIHPDLNGDCEIFETDCAPGKEGHPHAFLSCFLKKTGSYNLAAGTDYLLDADTYHTTRDTRFAITLLRRPAQAEKVSASVVKKRGEDTTCPFKNSEAMPTSKIWEHIDAALTNTRKRYANAR
jgi:hypothetical protein